MGNIQKERIEERLAALDISAFEAARRAGLNRTIISDLTGGRKQSIKLKYIPDIAAVLGCDPEYIMGYQDEPIKRPSEEDFAASGALIPVDSRCERGSWREASASRRLTKGLWVEPDPRFPKSAQRAFWVIGDDAEDLGVQDGSMIVVGLRKELERLGRSIINRDVVVVENINGNLYEYTVRRYIVNKGRAYLVYGDSLDEEYEECDLCDNRIYGVVLIEKRIFSLNY